MDKAPDEPNKSAGCEPCAAASGPTRFILHPRLEKDCLPVGDLPLCRVLLMNNRHFPWLVLVPRKADKREWFDLSPEDYALAMEEIRMTAERLKAIVQADKINVAALGNQVPQLHIHIIARFQNDGAWPNPVWNCGIAPLPYAPQEVAEIVMKFNITKM